MMKHLKCNLASSLNQLTSVVFNSLSGTFNKLSLHSTRQLLMVKLNLLKASSGELKIYGGRYRTECDGWRWAVLASPWINALSKMKILSNSQFVSHSLLEHLPKKLLKWDQISWRWYSLSNTPKINIQTKTLRLAPWKRRDCPLSITRMNASTEYSNIFHRYTAKMFPPPPWSATEWNQSAFFIFSQLHPVGCTATFTLV